MVLGDHPTILAIFGSGTSPSIIRLIPVCLRSWVRTASGSACNARTASSTIPNFTMTSTTKMALSHTLGIKYVICAPLPDHMKTIDDWKWQADQLNSLGERVKKAGFQLGYHNHEVEFVDIGGVTPYDVLVDRCDPSLVGFQIDVGNLTFGGKDAIHYLNKYPDRYFSMHAKDYRPGKTSVPVGKGILDWPKIFTIVKEKTKIRTYYAEVAAYAIGSLHGIPATAWPGDSIDELRESAEYLKSLNV